MDDSTCGKIGMHLHAPLLLTTPTSLAPALDGARQIAQHREEMAHATDLLLLGLDRRILDIPME
jgi:hypothetical protein